MTPVTIIKREPRDDDDDPRPLKRSPSAPSLPTTTVEALIASTGATPSTPHRHPHHQQQQREQLLLQQQQTPATTGTTRRNADELTPPDQGINRKRVRVIESGGDLLAEVKQCYEYTRGANIYTSAAPTPTGSRSPVKSERSETPSSTLQQQRPDSTVETPQHPLYWQQQQQQQPPPQTYAAPNAYQHNGIPQPAAIGGMYPNTGGGVGAGVPPRGYANQPSHYQHPGADYDLQQYAPRQGQPAYGQPSSHLALQQQQQTYARTRMISYQQQQQQQHQQQQQQQQPPTTTTTTAAASSSQHQAYAAQIQMRTAYHQAPQAITPSLQPLGFEPVLGATSLPNLNQRPNLPYTGANPTQHGGSIIYLSLYLSLSLSLSLFLSLYL